MCKRGTEGGREEEGRKSKSNTWNGSNWARDQTARKCEDIGRRNVGAEMAEKVGEIIAGSPKGVVWGLGPDS